MSSFRRITKHPKTGEWETAWWLDDYFGPHRYGVQFASTNETFKEEDYEWETREPIQESDYDTFQDSFHEWLELHGVKILGDDIPFVSTIDLNKLKLGILKLMSHKDDLVV